MGSLSRIGPYAFLLIMYQCTGVSNNIVSLNEPIDGLPPMIPNSVAVSEKSGDLYWTDSSTSHRLYDGVYTLLSNENGRSV